MGWSSCGTDSQGRPIGYGHDGICDHPGCEEEIDRGLAYACGGDHGGGEWFCERYFCAEHLMFVNAPDDLNISNGLCQECAHLFSSAFPDCDCCGGWGHIPVQVPVRGLDNEIVDVEIQRVPCVLCDKYGVFKSEIDWEQSTEYDDEGVTMHDWTVHAVHPEIEGSTCKCGAGEGEPCRGRDEDDKLVTLPFSQIHYERRAA